MKHPMLEALGNNIDDFPCRELPVRSAICWSKMELGQKNMNFGSIDKNEKRTRIIVVKNASETPLLYAVRKSGSIASGDVLFGDGRFGIIRGYGKREIEFIFEPTIAGKYVETLNIENVFDREGDLKLTLKANIKKPSNFFIQSSFLNFGLCMLDDISTQTQSIIICNTSYKQSRQFELRLDTTAIKTDTCKVDVIFEFEPTEEYRDVHFITQSNDRSWKKRGSSMLSKDVEDQIEHTEQKLKIAERKNQPDKIKKLKDKLSHLKSGMTIEKYLTDDTDLPTNRLPDKENQPNLQRKLHSAVVNVEPRERKTIKIYFISQSLVLDSPQNNMSGRNDDSSMEICTGQIIVNEYRNTDVIKTVRSRYDDLSL
jgi:hypothetical protein